MKTELNIGILASGQLGYLTVLSLFDRSIFPSLLFTDKGSTNLISFAEQNRIPLFIGNPRKGTGLNFINCLTNAPNFLLSINYIFLLEQDIISYPKYGCVNIHGSLLPKYRGRTPHVWAIINNEKITGITAHYIDDGCDTGPILFQEFITIEHHFTGGDILKVFEKQYPGIVQKTVELVESGLDRGRLQDERNATYFGKRTPEDGRINWDWQRERIYNWVRALADPYPGAYSFYEGKKVVFDKIIFTETGYSWNVENGTIVIGGNFPEVKTPNGLVKVIKHRANFIFEKGNRLQ